ncbi:hypothetical protein GOBAR_DD08866 [Gossypium barbadense]|nr:hypothetical protein GOBAR_DD08866 [Gossypium barbadense]
MGALAPALSTWIAEDDLLLKNAIEILEDKVDNETINWMMENFKLSVKQQIEAVLTKDELQHLAFLCKSEVDSIGRLTAGILRLLKLENRNCESEGGGKKMKAKRKLGDSVDGKRDLKR